MGTERREREGRERSDARNLRLVVQYRGERFAGWQVQPHARTVQGELERAIAEITREDVRIVAASRTDAGVHALGQVASWTTTSRLPCPALRAGLNAVLPEDASVREVEEVPADFHARFSARGKLYRYRVLADPVRSPIEAATAWHVPQPLDLDAMRAAAGHLVGRHDVAAFACRPDGDDTGDTTRTLHEVRIEREPRTAEAAGAPRPVVTIDVRGDGFLYKMVRTIVGTLVLCGRRRLDPGALPAILASRDRRRAGPTAPPHGLFLVRVLYDEARTPDGDDLAGLVAARSRA